MHFVPCSFKPLTTSIRKNQQELITCKVTVTVEWLVYELFNSLSSLCPGEEPFYQPLGEADPLEPLYSPTEYQPHALDNSGVPDPDHSGQSGVIREFPLDADTSADWGYSLPVSGSRDLGGGAGETQLSSQTSVLRESWEELQCFTTGNSQVFD